MKRDAKHEPQERFETVFFSSARQLPVRSALKDCVQRPCFYSSFGSRVYGNFISFYYYIQLGRKSQACKITIIAKSKKNLLGIMTYRKRTSFEQQWKNLKKTIDNSALLWYTAVVFEMILWLYRSANCENNCPSVEPDFFSGYTINIQRRYPT